MKQAVILAGGKGTRLKSRLGGLPKPLVDVCGKPLLERQIELLKRFGYTKVLLLTNHGARQIESFCVNENNWDIDIKCIDDGNPRGTAGATLAVYDRLNDEFLIMYGDTMLEIDLDRFEAFHRTRPDASATLFLHPNDHPYDSDLVDIGENGLIKAFYPHPHDTKHYYPNLVNAALYYFRRDALKPWKNTIESLDFGKDLFPLMLANGDRLFGYKSPEYIKDCGTPPRLDQVREDFYLGRISKANLKLKQCAVFLDRDGVINKETSHIFTHEQFELLPGAEKAIKRINSSNYRAVVVTNQPVIARGNCSFTMLEKIHNKMESLLGQKGAYLDQIYFCPHHPDSGYDGEIAELKIDCNCRKPKTGMIERAVNELNIDCEFSWLIGDTTVDLLTAERSGVSSILVETGFSGLDRRHWITPDFIVPNLQAAVDFILDDYPRLLAICENYGKNIHSGDFVFIGGLSRSGKSNMAGCLSRFLKLRGQHTIVLNLDHWLHDGTERTPSVLGRYNIKKIKELITQLTRRETSMTFSFPFYDKLGQHCIDEANHVTINKEDIIIIEGTIALLLIDSEIEQKLHTWFIEVDEVERRNRVLQEYRLRGSSTHEAKLIYNNRQRDETPVILESAKNAQYKIMLGLGKTYKKQPPHDQGSQL